MHCIHQPGIARLKRWGLLEITAEGITDAFRDAELLSAALDDAFAGRRPIEEALAGYERAPDEAVMHTYQFTCDLAKLAPPPPPMQKLFASLRGNAVESGRFMGTIAGRCRLRSSSRWRTSSA